VRLAGDGGTNEGHRWNAAHYEYSRSLLERFSLHNLLSPPPDAPSLPAPQVASTYRYWRQRQLYSTFIGYAMFYFVRKNIPIALPLIEKSMKISKSDLGKFLSIHDIVYGCSKFLNGMVGDRSNPRVLMTVGLLLSALSNLCFGWSSTLFTFSLWWILNGWFQGMGFPPCARILSHWFSQKERGTKWAIWNTSHQVGAGGVLILSGFLGDHYGWRAIFFGPALIALVTCVFLANRLRDTPGSLGLPPVEQFTGESPVMKTRAESEQSFWRMLTSRVFTNPYIWLICFANFFVYVIRYSFLNWAPDYLTQVQHLSNTQGGMIDASFEVAGLFGSLLAGFVSDRYLRGRRAPLCVVYMLMTGVAIYGFGLVPEHSPWLSGLALFGVGFFIYGPQFLVGVMTVDIASKDAAASAIGLTGFFGYLSGFASGWGNAYLVEHYGWSTSFKTLQIASVLGAGLFALCWNARAKKAG
jgi:phosphoglycerate transporter family protein